MKNKASQDYFHKTYLYLTTCHCSFTVKLLAFSWSGFFAVCSPKKRKLENRFVFEFLRNRMMLSHIFELQYNAIMPVGCELVVLYEFSNTFYLEKFY